MAKIRNPARFSEHFKVAPAALAKLGALNPTLNVDTRLFIDPLLLEASGHPEISGDGRKAYVQHFRTAISLLQKVKKTDDTDVAWRNVSRLLSFPEIKGTCLGYGAESISGSGSGEEMTGQVLATAKAIVDLGVEDPDLFVALALFEDNFGPDRISDMTTNIIFGALLKFNERVLVKLQVPTEEFNIRLKNGETFSAQLPRNSFAKGNVPVILVPTDVLRDLPIATDWSDVSTAAAKSAEIRSRVNKDIAKLWQRKTLKDKGAVKHWAMSSKKAFQTLLDSMHQVERSPYDIEGDPKGELAWRQVLVDLAARQPFEIKKPSTLNLRGVSSVVDQIVQQFKFLIEDRRFSEELYHDGKPRPERAAQRLFYAVAHSYCKANNLDITPEAETGAGPVDFKVSKGFNGRVLVEIKLSTNNKVVVGYKKQLGAYKTAEETTYGCYVVIDVDGRLARKRRQLEREQRAAVEQGETVSKIIYIDGKRRPSASKR